MDDHSKPTFLKNNKVDDDLAHYQVRYIIIALINVIVNKCYIFLKENIDEKNEPRWL